MLSGFGAAVLNSGAMAQALDPAIRELLEWVGRRPRSYEEAMEAWRSTCPRHSTWEDASLDGLVQVCDGRVLLTEAGQAVLIPRGLALAQKLERAEAAGNVDFVEARARVFPDAGACWIEVAGAYAMFDGVGSPCTQTFGLGLFATPAESDFETIERFFRERGAAVHHEICPIAGARLLPVLNARGYRPIEISDVLFLPLPGKAEASDVASPLRVRTVGEPEHDVWAATATEGWREVGDFTELMRASAARRRAVDFLVEWDGSPIAAASLVIHDGVGLMAGASTIPQWRGRGAQQALFQARLTYAAEAGCNLAMVVTEPGSASERNAQRHGFQMAYTRTKWMLPAAA